MADQNQLVYVDLDMDHLNATRQPKRKDGVMSNATVEYATIEQAMKGTDQQNNTH